MPDTTDLFADFGPEFTPKPARLEMVAGLVVANMGKPTAAQKRFNKLIASIEAARAESEALRRVADAQRPAHHQVMHQLSTEIVQLRKDMLVFLDQRLQTKGLTATQKQHATRILLSLCEQMAHLDDADIAAVLARYRTPQDLAERERQEELAAQEVNDFMAHEHAQATARAGKREAKKAKRAPTAREQATADAQLDAQSALRTIYRQLASVLHPDREVDAAERVRKTALMSEVNAAYERKDLNALLRMQLQIAQIDSSKLTALSDEKLQAMCLLLAQQYEALQEDIQSQRMALAHHFGYPPHVRFCEDDLLDAMQGQQQSLKDEAEFMREDLGAVQDDKAFKAWLKEQTRVTKANQRQADAIISMDDILFEMMRRG